MHKLVLKSFVTLMNGYMREYGKTKEEVNQMHFANSELIAVSIRSKELKETEIAQFEKAIETLLNYAYIQKEITFGNYRTEKGHSKGDYVRSTKYKLTEKGKNQLKQR